MLLTPTHLFEVITDSLLGERRYPSNSGGPAMIPALLLAGAGLLALAGAAALEPGGLSYLFLNLGILAICWAGIEIWCQLRDRYRRQP